MRSIRISTAWRLISGVVSILIAAEARAARSPEIVSVESYQDNVGASHVKVFLR